VRKSGHAATEQPLHATTVAIGGRAVLITGVSGAGKSDLALRLIDRGAVLVADDRTLLAARGGRLFASPPATIAGRIEVRGIGILALPHAAEVPVALVVDLDSAPERLPETRVKTLLGLDIPLIALDARENSAAIKVELALSRRPMALD
jgi:serine kinase of HPr protein (carbohydrate metabolism regulator)